MKTTVTFSTHPKLQELPEGETTVTHITISYDTQLDITTTTIQSRVFLNTGATIEIHGATETHESVYTERALYRFNNLVGLEEVGTFGRQHSSTRVSLS